MDFNHKSIMVAEVLNSLNIKSDGIYLDCTLGGGGHALAIGKKLSAQGKIIGIDQDEDAIKAATENLSGLACDVKIIRGNFSKLNEILDDLDVDKIDGALFDLGVSSYQIDTPERGFSYMKDSPLDMRMDRRRSLTAREVINNYEEDRLIKIFREYGEERFSKRIAAAICRERKISPIETTGELVKIIESNAPHTKNGGHPAKRIFQAIRIEVNGELEILSDAIKNAVARLKIGGRLAVITFHSLEDRIVKETLKTLAQGCICPKNFPVCVCNHKAAIKILGKAITPAQIEIKSNSRAKSAKLRVADKIFDINSEEE
ncbi:MAG: 16S rRNA (cytosine(1402)-N(4))-methyltransferase RsmH [Selenomonadaceae bacterium]|nr:16S rRNA (cytosine(1402)-N(4))-methyltransferase RsmH [Selenomonadaceae bacterium]